MKARSRRLPFKSFEQIIAKDLDGLLKTAIEDHWTIGSGVTDDAGQCGRARRISALRWPKMVFLRCFAHDINNLVKQAGRISKDSA